MTDNLPRVVADVPLGPPPAWAVLQRRLFDALDEAWRAFAARYCEPDGRLTYHGPAASRDGADDFYEAFFNWPTLYRLGGADDLLDAAKHHWEGVTAQLTELGYLVDEFERGYDWFHQGESLLLFYEICAADPRDAAFRERAYRFAELYLPGSPTGNYDPATDTIRAPHNGACGPRYGINEEWSSYHAGLASMRPYGLPLPDVPGVTTWADLEDPDKAARMGAAMRERIGRGDVAVNLAATSLAVNAWLYGHEERFGAWALRYIDAWRRRAEDNGGILPDNVGPSGKVGELHGGRWYGGNYGWLWPHGIYSVGAAAAVAAVNTVLLTGTTDRLDIGRGPLDTVLRHGVRGAVTETEMSIRDRWLAELGEDASRPTLLVPNRHGDAGWFDYQPPQLGLPLWLWQAGGDPADLERIERIRRESGYDWRPVRHFRNKEEAGHEAPWLAYLRGENPGYPEAMLTAALGQVERRMKLIDADRADLGEIHVHHWQRLNPVLTEALLQLTTGTPQVLYNGGLLPTRLAYFDAERRRPGLPPDVAALVDASRPDRAGVELVNLGLTRARRLVVQAGTYAEHAFTAVSATTVSATTVSATTVSATAGPGYPGDPRAYTAPEVVTARREVAVGGPRLEVVLPPGTRVHLDLRMTPHANRAAHNHL
ncbi:hypothetical protein HNP84_001005 [Thermocatellispora tengchongensis]|uniref:Uncharacterized protein n=1 Tax=Thermocatellispora tengchongensis TaxID=1073253 RepID=A0A840NWX7_9ACTN|nr:hypothetical protein [Thermocatellispora tengchongensis]MBB5131299.1 hypothetical protein [Thermocatellispora tengchongensis]